MRKPVERAGGTIKVMLIMIGTVQTVKAIIVPIGQAITIHVKSGKGDKAWPSILR